MTGKILLCAAVLSLVACSKAPPPPPQQQGDPSLAVPPPDVDASKAAGNGDLVPFAPPTPSGQESTKPLRPLPATSAGHD